MWLYLGGVSVTVDVFEVCMCMSGCVEMGCVQECSCVSIEYVCERGCI